MKEIKWDEIVSYGGGGRVVLVKGEGECFLGGLWWIEIGIIGRRFFIWGR